MHATLQQACGTARCTKAFRCSQEPRAAAHPELAQPSHGLGARLVEVAQLGLGDLGLLAGQVPRLHRAVPVGSVGLDLGHHVAALQGDHGGGIRGALSSVNLRHPGLGAPQAHARRFGPGHHQRLPAPSSAAAMLPAGGPEGGGGEPGAWQPEGGEAVARRGEGGRGVGAAGRPGRVAGRGGRRPHGGGAGGRGRGGGRRGGGWWHRGGPTAALTRRLGGGGDVTPGLSGARDPARPGPPPPVCWPSDQQQRCPPPSSSPCPGVWCECNAMAQSEVGRSVLSSSLGAACGVCVDVSD